MKPLDFQKSDSALKTPYEAILSSLNNLPNLRTMTQIGVIEGFFGPPWDIDSRLAFADLMQKHGGDFFLYAPKSDSALRRNWRNTWPPNYLKTIETLCHEFHKRGLLFGVGLSPFGLQHPISQVDSELLKVRIEALNNLGIDLLGVFFDDMPSNPNLLEIQAKVIEWIRASFHNKVIFCPSYYSLDPKLDQVFGQRPTGYIEGLNREIPSDVAICWTGPQVISSEITTDHLGYISTVLGRKPFIWENLYANDGPRNCKFLKLKYFEGRSPNILNLVGGIGLNLMNQPYLSQLVFLSTLFSLRDMIPPEASFLKSCETLCIPKLAKYICDNRELFLNQGLESLSHLKITSLKEELTNIISSSKSEASIGNYSMQLSLKIVKEISLWLEGYYIVGEDCLTD